MVNNYRVSPTDIPTTLLVQPINRSLSVYGPIPHRKCSRQNCVLAVVTAAVTLLVAALVSATVLIWLSLAGVFSNQAKNATDSSASKLVNASLNSSAPYLKYADFDNISNVSAPASFVFSRTSVDYIDYPAVTEASFRTQQTSGIATVFASCQGGDSQIQCVRDGRCLPLSKRCNKVKDCIDGSDEFNCSCLEVLRSTGSYKICDGYADCPGYADERDCAYQCAQSTQFRCAINGQCVNKQQVCDGRNDCQDGEDENECWMLAPTVDTTLTMRYEAIYDFGYAFRRINGVWRPVSYIEIESANQREAELANVAAFVCKSAGFKAALYGGARVLSDSRAPGCYVAKNIIDVTLTGNAPTAEPQFEQRSSCPRNTALYVACSQMVCGHVPKCKPPTKRVVGGTETGPYCNPWTVALYRNGEMRCQAVVLNHNWLLTAAHCFKGSEHYRWTARLGMYRQFSWNPNVVIRRVVSARLHPNYTNTGVETNDIALIKLDRPVTYSASMQPPCMPRTDPEHLDDFDPMDGDRCTVYGWGYLVEQGPDLSDDLRQAELTVISNDRCNTSQTNIFRSKMTPGHLCLGHGLEVKDACQGDSGGPLICARSGGDRSRYLAGITSTGNGCARPNVPGIWTRVLMYMSWIQSSLNATLQGVNQMLTVGSTQPCTGFQCATGECIYSFLRCDGTWDCPLGSDETFCARNTTAPSSVIVPGSATTAASTSTFFGGSKCARRTSTDTNEEDGFLCSDGLTCLPYYQRCDYVLDCPGGDDEQNCYNCLDSDILCEDQRRCLPFNNNHIIHNEAFALWAKHRFACNGTES